MKLLFLLLFYVCTSARAIHYSQTALKILDHYINEVLDSGGNETECVKQLQLLVSDIKNSQIWAAQMMDATAKFQPGLLTGNSIILGNYDECLAINVKRNGSRIKGKYCRTTIKPVQSVDQCIDAKFLEKKIYGLGTTTTAQLKYFISASWDVCIPEACTEGDMQELWNYAENRYEIKFHAKFEESLCTTIEKQEDYSLLDITAITIFGIIGVIILLSTLYDIFIFQRRKEKEYNLFMAFSYYTNGKRLLAHKNTRVTSITCLHGIRVISIVWIILGHRCLLNYIGTAVNTTYAMEWLKHEENMFIIGAFACVDSFLVMSGFLLVYIVLDAKENGIELNLFMFYFHRLLRLSPSVAAVMLVYVGILNHLGSGPFWNYVDQYLISPCEINWWCTLLYVQNYIRPMRTCIIQTWYLAVDTQLYMLSPLLLLPLQKWPNITVTVISALIVASIAGNVHATYYYQLDSTAISIEGMMNYIKHVYSPTQLRMGPWLAGTLLGYFMFQYRNKEITIKKRYVLLLWTTSIILMLFTMYGYQALLKYKFTLFMAAICFGFGHIIWGMCICWVIFACHRGFGGYINKFLSLTIFRILARLTYSMFITHGIVLGLVEGQRGTNSYVDNLILFHEFWGDFAFTLGLSVIWTLTFESPVTILEKKLIERALKRNQTSEELYISKIL